MTALNIKSNFDQAIASFKRADAACKISVLWHIYQKLGQGVVAPAPVAMYSQVVNHLIRHLQQVSREDRTEALMDIASGAETRFGREYTHLNINMRLAFWYRLSTSSEPAMLAAAERGRGKSELGQEIIRFLEGIDLNQQVHFLRQALSV